jgi:glycosyltransferase involved in cell wall biosynthesis
MTDSVSPQPWLSVLIPVYNVESYLDACVRSVLVQGIPGVEVLLLNDAATDGSAGVMQMLAQTNPDTVRLFAHPHNRGLAAARNTLLSHARGAYVWFLDSDDLIFPGSIEMLSNITMMHAPDLVLCDFAYVRERTSWVQRFRGDGHRKTFISLPPAIREIIPEKFLCLDREKLLAGLIGGGELHAWSKIARREVWQQAPFTEGRYFEDIPTIAALVAATQRYVYVPQPWVGYRQRSGSILSHYSAEKLRHLLLSIQDINRDARKLIANEAFACAPIVEDFCLRAVASGARHMVRLASAHEAVDVRARYFAALPELFPGGVISVLQHWRSKGWWLRAIRVRSRLKKAGLL